MTLTEYADLEQGSAEWLDARRGIVTASVIGKLITPKTVRVANNDDSRGLALLLASERITGWTEETFVSSDMFRGQMDEPVARDLYSEHYAPVTELGFMVLERDGWRLGFSPDGLVGSDGLIEIKSRRPKSQVATILADEVPTYNVAQLQAGLFVTGRAWIDYVSYAAGLPLYVKRVYPDPKWFEAIAEAVATTETAIAEITDRYAERVIGLHMTERLELEEMTF